MPWPKHPPIQRLTRFTKHTVDVLRLDKLHPVIGGNKHYKLKYNLQAAAASPHRTVLTFGGAHSNHIAATALECREAGLNAIGIIRGGEVQSPTLQFAASCGMQLIFEKRIDYAGKRSQDYLFNLRERFGEFHLVPEGGFNYEGVRGCMEMVPLGLEYDYILCACGTGATFAGLLLSNGGTSIITGISVLKGENKLPQAVASFLEGHQMVRVEGDEVLGNQVIKQHCIISRFAFSGYARFDEELVAFKESFELEHGLTLDHVYTSKLFFAADALFAEDRFPPCSKVLLIHSGGLQGNAGFEMRYQRKLMR